MTNIRRVWVEVKDVEISVLLEAYTYTLRR